MKAMMLQPNYAILDVEVEVHDYPSTPSQTEEVDLYWHFGKKKN